MQIDKQTNKQTHTQKKKNKQQQRTVSTRANAGAGREDVRPADGGKATRAGRDADERCSLRGIKVLARVTLDEQAGAGVERGGVGGRAHARMLHLSGNAPWDESAGCSDGAGPNRCTADARGVGICGSFPVTGSRCCCCCWWGHADGDGVHVQEVEASKDGTEPAKRLREFASAKRRHNERARAEHASRGEEAGHGIDALLCISTAIEPRHGAENVLLQLRRQLE